MSIILTLLAVVAVLAVLFVVIGIIGSERETARIQRAYAAMRPAVAVPFWRSHVAQYIAGTLLVVGLFALIAWLS